jgi:hypothetical protein
MGLRWRCLFLPYCGQHFSAGNVAGNVGNTQMLSNFPWERWLVMALNVFVCWTPKWKSSFV